MTFLASTYRVPRLRTKDVNCTLSWFEGTDLPSVGATTGNYPNRGSLGDQAELRLNASSFVRPGYPGVCGGTVPMLDPVNTSTGFCTDNTLLGESNTITLEFWMLATSMANRPLLLSKLYNNDTSPWRQPYGLLIAIESARFMSYYVVSGPSVAAVATECYMPTGSWNHYGVTWAHNDYIRFYYNGGLVFTSPTTLPIMWGDHGRWLVGGRGGVSSPDLVGDGLPGAMQGVRVHNVVRSASWMQETFNLGSGVL